MGQTKQIVIAEDDTDVWGLLELCLNEDDWKLSFFDNARDAFEFVKSNSVDLVISDYILPCMNGIELCKAIKKFSAETFIPVLLMTAETKAVTEAAGLNFGADDYVAKPFGPAELKARVNSLIRIKGLVEQLGETQKLLREEEKKVLALSVVGSAAHRLGQPLTSLTLLCEQLRLDATPQELVEDILELSNEVSKILSQLKNACDITSVSYINDFSISDFHE